jgi:hypothetical protein
MSCTKATNFKNQFSLIFLLLCSVLFISCGNDLSSEGNNKRKLPSKDINREELSLEEINKRINESPQYKKIITYPLKVSKDNKPMVRDRNDKITKESYKRLSDNGLIIYSEINDGKYVVHLTDQGKQYIFQDKNFHLEKYENIKLAERAFDKIISVKYMEKATEITVLPSGQVVNVDKRGAGKNDIAFVEYTTKAVNITPFGKILLGEKDLTETHSILFRRTEDGWKIE